MSFRLKYQVVVEYIGNGSGPVSVPSQQIITLGQLGLDGIGLQTYAGQPIGYQQVPGGNSPTQGNFDTATTAMATDISTAIAANLTQIQAFATGGG